MRSPLPEGFRCQGISKSFITNQGLLLALQNIEILVGEQEFVCIVGPSGCGKTTLLKILAGVVKPNSGKVTFADNGINRLQTAMVFQDQGLFPWMTVRDNVAFGLEMQHTGKHERHARADEMLDRVGLGEFIRSYPHQLSGGMLQRVAILRAFLSDPHILLMDEPFGSLDSQTRTVMQDELLRTWREHLRTVVYVTHDIDEAILLGDRILVMSGRPGSIIADIPVDLPRPRQLADRDHPKVMALRQKIWKMIEHEVRRELGMQP
jgi:NitT/TauT family transport system ATP-binding protein